MPLSENEQKLLEQMERALYAEDPRFATQMRGAGAGGHSRKRVATGVVAAIAGLALVIGGVSTQIIAIGVAGFVVMVAGVAWAFTSGGKGPQQAGPVRGAMPGRKRPGTSAGSFNQRLEERWEKRRRENGGL